LRTGPGGAVEPPDPRAPGPAGGMVMRRRLEAAEERYEELVRLMADPDVISDQERWRGLATEHAALEEQVSLYRRYRTVEKELEEARTLLRDEKDPDVRQLAREEVEALESEKERLQRDLRASLLPRDPLDEKGVILEIRAGAGGDEAALFAGDLGRMYRRYAERRGWKTEMLGVHETDMGGVKEAAIAVGGRGAYSRLKYESGVHRVQRVPVTESSGRIHTSTATVAVLPEAEEVDVDVDPDDLQIETFRSSGPGGQHVNKTESAVRITHLPTGVVVSCQDEKSQHKNRQKAMRVLRARLLRMAAEQQQEEMDALRRSQVGSGDRSERVRTYNFPQMRVTDHRIGLTVHNLTEVLDGDLDEIIDALAAEEQARALKAAE